MKAYLCAGFFKYSFEYFLKKLSSLYNAFDLSLLCLKFFQVQSSLCGNLRVDLLFICDKLSRE